MAVTAANSAQVVPESRLICRVCQKQFSKYTCPQCNVKYCSLACYKSHSLRCTESFARNNVMEEMRDIQATKESQQSMLESLKRIHFDEAGRSIFEDESLADDTADDKDDLVESRGNILSDKTIRLIEQGRDVSWDALSADERSAFLRAIAAGELNQYIEPWNPWWFNSEAKNILLTEYGTSLVQPVSRVDNVSETSGTFENSTSVLPKPPSRALVRVNELMRGDPSPSVSLLSAELIYSYCFTMRFCNGDWQSEPIEAASILLSVSRALDQASAPDSVGEVFLETVKTICSHSFKHAGGFTFAVSLFDDTVALLRLGRACVLCALADLQRLLESAKKGLKLELRDEREVDVSAEGKSRVVAGSLDSTAIKSGGPSVSGSKQNSNSPLENAFVEMRRKRYSQRGLDGKRNFLFKEQRSPNKSNEGKNLSEAVAVPPRRKAQKANAELRKINAAIRKVYFLMCWSNEQDSETFSSLAQLVGSEKDKLLEIGSADKIGLKVVQEVKTPINVHRPIIEEVAQKPTHDDKLRGTFS